MNRIIQRSNIDVSTSWSAVAMRWQILLFSLPVLPLIIMDQHLVKASKFSGAFVYYILHGQRQSNSAQSIAATNSMKLGLLLWKTSNINTTHTRQHAYIIDIITPRHSFPPWRLSLLLLLDPAGLWLGEQVGCIPYLFHSCRPPWWKFHRQAISSMWGIWLREITLLMPTSTDTVHQM